MALTVLPPPSTRAVKSVQNFTITISGGSSSNTATISSVDTSKCEIQFHGARGGGSTEIRSSRVSVTLTDATTVTASRGNTTNSATVSGTVIEYY